MGSPGAKPGLRTIRSGQERTVAVVETEKDGRKVLEVEALSKAEALSIVRTLDDLPVVITSVVSVKNTLFRS